MGQKDRKMKPTFKIPEWISKVANTAQVGGIETSIVDNGLARGSRIAWFNTGSGLRFKVLMDRCLDIADAFYNRYSLVWLSHSGNSFPRSDANRDLIWLESFVGGLLTTCGLTHIGPPESEGSRQRGLHGRISNIPAEIISIIQPEPDQGKMEMSMTAKMIETSVFGPSLQLTRTISCILDKPVITIHDRVKNLGNQDVPHMILYHCNFGFPLVDQGTELVCKGDWKSRGLPLDDARFGKSNYKRCPNPLTEHNGLGEAGAFINPQSDKKGKCLAGLYNPKLKIGISLKFLKSQLPCLSNWQHWGKREYVTAFSPATNYPVGQAAARKQKTLGYIRPGETMDYNLEFEVLTKNVLAVLNASK
jgi:hypothetical protein